LTSSRIFDQSHYDVLNAARDATVDGILPDLIGRLGLKTALDLGCGLGHYAEILHKYGLDVLAVDGRAENVEEARRRYPYLKFQVADAQDPALTNFGKFDLVFCFGLLYHLENPFRVIRGIEKLAVKLTLIEGIVYPSPEPVMVLMDENHGADQGLNFMAFYPSETCLVKMLRRAGFLECYTPNRMPNHPEYQVGGNGFRRRTVLAASKVPVNSASLEAWPDPSPEHDPWAMLPLYPAHQRTSVAYRLVDGLLHTKRRRGTSK
jgi:SAM-dependent methyltransferase